MRVDHPLKSAAPEDVLGQPSIHGERLSSHELERYRGRPPEEIACDNFAAECLVPWKPIQQFAGECDFSASTVITLSDHFQASRPCIASRFARSSANLVAYVLSEDGVI